MMPGVRYLPPASMTVALAGAVTMLADGGDLAVLYIDGAVLDVAVSDGHHGGVLDDNFIVNGGLRDGGGGEQRQAGAEERKDSCRH